MPPPAFDKLRALAIGSQAIGLILIITLETVMGTVHALAGRGACGDGRDCINHRPRASLSTQLSSQALGRTS